MAYAVFKTGGKQYRVAQGDVLDVEKLDLEVGGTATFSDLLFYADGDSTKLAAETVALEYGEAFGFPVWIDRCGVLAGAGQFGRADQGVGKRIGSAPVASSRAS